jgi:hypothetical protein
MTLAMAAKLITRYFNKVMVNVIMWRIICHSIYECLLKYLTDEITHTLKYNMQPLSNPYSF